VLWRAVLWCAVQGECHTRQHFHYMGQTGEVHADQAHRGYNTATDEAGYAALNPLYMRWVTNRGALYEIRAVSSWHVCTG
jgi:D-galacturonate reductase